MYIRMDGLSHSQSLSSRLGHCEFLEIDEEDLDTSNLHAHVVGQEARRSLLVDRHPWTVNPDASTEADTLLGDLGRLAPGVAKDFVAKSAARDALVFRLINDVGHVEDEESYIALSYCWKKVNHDTPRTLVSPAGDLPFGWVRTVEQFPLPTTPAMFQAVLMERQSENEGVWFDQVCINQEDEGEKATAIGTIDSIYKNARTVVVALDDIAAYEDEAAFLRHYLTQYSCSNLPINQQPNRGLNPPFMESHATFRCFFERFLGSIWFERAWCAHEMRMGRSHVFLVPCISNEDESYSFIRFTGAFFFHMLVLASELPSMFSGQQARLRSLFDFFGRRTLMDVRDAIASRSPDARSHPILEPIAFVPLIADVFKMKAGGNPRLPEYLRRLDANRDRTSIALNTAGFPLALKPASSLQRPNIEDECLRQLLLVGLAARDPVTLCTTGTSLQLHDGSTSWLCRPAPLDIISQPNRQPLPRFPSEAHPISQASDGRAEYIQLDLIFLDLPHRTHPNPHFPTHIQRARAIINTCTHHQIQTHHPMWTSWQTAAHPRAPSMQNLFIQTLACILDCGPHWLLDTASSSSSKTPILSPHIIHNLCNPHLTPQTYISTNEAQHAFSLLLTFLSTLITSGIPWSSGATEGTYGPLIVSSPHSQSQSHTDLCPTTKALIFAPYSHSKTLLVAIPEVLKSTRYDVLARAWILVPNPNSNRPMPRIGNPNPGSWTLRGKAVVSGGRGFCAWLAGAGAVHREGGRVYGAG